MTHLRTYNNLIQVNVKQGDTTHYNC